VGCLRPSCNNRELENNSTILSLDILQNAETKAMFTSEVNIVGAFVLYKQLKKAMHTTLTLNNAVPNS
jgi:preprotein translocase subunit SecB